MKTLKISKEITMPLDAVTQTFAMIGRKGAGKTYLASMIAEQMLDAQSQVVVVDCVGVWWGLRVAADGKSKGKEIFVIGGEHGDIPLVPTAGAKVAKLLIEKGISAVLDVSGFRIGEHKRFAAEFAEEFFHLKKIHRTPVHIFIEEAQKIIPQRVGPDEARMVGAFEQIVRLGRNYGIGCSLVTQRPQSVNKEVLSQIECLCVLQVTGPHERKAIEEWVQEVGADRTLVKELPGLARGEGYVWSPSWLRIYKKVHFSQKQTFDASATPEVGKAVKQARLSAVDVESIKKDMAEVIDQAEKDNPVVLRRRIAELEKEYKKEILSNISQKTSAPDPELIGAVISDTERRMNIEFMAERDEFLKHINAMFQIITTVAQTVKDIKMPDLKARAKKTLTYKEIMQPVNVIPGSPIFSKEALQRADKLASEQNIPIGMTFAKKADYVDMNGIKPITGGALRMLKVLVSRSPMKLTKAQLATFSKLKSSSGTFGTYLSTLKSGNLIVVENDLYYATEEGLAYLGDTPNPPQTNEEIISMWRENLSGGALRMFDHLTEIYPGQTTKESLGEIIGMTHTSGSFGTYLSMLRSNGLIDTKGVEIKLSDNLFI